MKIERRGFLASLLALPAAVKAFVAAPVAVAKPQRLMFHPDAFKLSMEPTRMDVMYGWASIRPGYTIQITDDGTDV